MLREIPTACVQVDALISLLLEVVLRDSIFVDASFTSTWQESQECFLPLIHGGLIRPVPFLSQVDVLREPTKIIVNELCTTSTLRDVQRQNEISWERERKAKDRYMSSVIWGTAGMLSRSHVFEVPYSGHPLRRRVIEQTLMRQKPDPVLQTLGWIQRERLRIFETRNNGGTQRQAILVLPPILIDVIEEASDVNDLLLTAIQLREKYRLLREWLRTVESAIEAEDAKKVAKYQRTLNALTKDVDRSMALSEGGKISTRIGFGYPSLSITLGTFEGVLKRFGVRAMLNKLVFTARGEKSLNKLLRMFGESKSSALGLSVLRYLSRAP